MPEIQEYLPQTQAQEPVGGVSPNIELAGTVGRSIRNLGETIEQGSTEIYRKVDQEQTADVYSSMADLRARYGARQNEEIKNGTYDHDKLMQDYDDEVADIGGDISSPGASRYLERQGSRIRGALLKTGLVGRAQISGKATAGNYINGMMNNSLYLVDRPEDFKDVFDGEREANQAILDADPGLSEKDRDNLIKTASKKYIEAALTGWVKKGDEGTKYAKSLLDSGFYDKTDDGTQLLDIDSKKQMYALVDHLQNANDAEAKRTRDRVRQARQDQDEAWFDKNHADIYSGRYSANQILQDERSGQIGHKAAQEALNIIRSNTDHRAQGDPAKFNRIGNRIIDESAEDHIDSIEELNQEAIRQGLPTSGKYGVQSLYSLFNKTPEQKQFNQSEKTLFQSIDSLKRDPVTHEKDSLGELKAAQARQDYITAKQKARQDGTLKDLLDAKNPNSFYSQLNNYVPTPQERLQYFRQQRLKNQLPPKNTPRPDEQDPAGMQKFLDRVK